MESKNIEYTVIAVLILILLGTAIYIVNDEDSNDETNELKKEINDLNNDLLYTEGMLNKYDGVFLCHLNIEGEGFYRIYCGDNFISEFRNTTDEDGTIVTIPIYCKDYPGNTFTVDIYKNGQFAANVTFDVDKITNMDTMESLDTIDMSGY